jgi:hypothetical protein
MFILRYADYAAELIYDALSCIVPALRSQQRSPALCREER